MHQPKTQVQDSRGRPFLVTLSRSEGSVSLGVEMLRCAQHDRVGSLVTPFTSFRARSEPSEGSLSLGLELLSCPQHDRVPLSPHSLRSGQALSAAKGLAPWRRDASLRSA